MVMAMMVYHISFNDYKRNSVLGFWQTVIAMTDIIIVVLHYYYFPLFDTQYLSVSQGQTLSPSPRYIALLETTFLNGFAEILGNGRLVVTHFNVYKVFNPDAFKMVMIGFQIHL